MRTVSLLALAMTLAVSQADAQARWVPIDGYPIQQLALDRASLQMVDSILTVEVRTVPGPQVYDIVRYQVQCGSMALKVVSRTQFWSDTHRAMQDSTGKRVVQVVSDGWMVFASGSDGRALAEAACRLARDQGIVG